MLIFQSRRLCCYQSLSVSSAVCVPPFGESSVYGWIYLFIYLCWLLVGFFSYDSKGEEEDEANVAFSFSSPFFFCAHPKKPVHPK
jgi:hypothetical protein